MVRLVALMKGNEMALSDRDLRHCRNRLYIVEPFNEELLTPLGYDLSPGFVVGLPKEPDGELEQLYPPRDESIDSSGDDRPYFSVSPRRGVVLVTKECVYLTGKLIATVHGRSRVTQDGIVVNPVTVDPNYSGQLILYFHNLSDKVVKVLGTSAVATLIFHKVGWKTESQPNSQNAGP